MIEIKNLSKSYSNKLILSDLNLNFNKGKIYGVIGKNGAGKTTFFSCIAGLESYKGGINYNSGNLKNDIGFLEATPYFLSKLTGHEYLRLLCKAKKVIYNKSLNENIFGLPLENYVETYSTGMKKKLAITAILLQRNEVYILDEPFSGIDIESNVLLTQIIKELKNQGKIVIISSHIFSILTDVCDELHYLCDGKIIETTSKDDFYKIEDKMKSEKISSKLDFLFQ